MNNKLSFNLIDKMANDSCIYCGKNFTYMTKHEYLYGQFDPIIIDDLRSYIKQFAEYGFNYRQGMKEEDKKIADNYYQLIHKIILDTIKNIDNKDIEEKFSEYCFHIADYVVSKTIYHSPGILVKACEKTTIDFSEVISGSDYSVGEYILHKKNYPMIMVYRLIGLNVHDKLPYYQIMQKLYPITKAIIDKDIFLVKFLLSLNVQLREEDLVLAENFEEMSESLNKIFFNQ